MNKKIILITVILIIVAIGAFLLLKKEGGVADWKTYTNKEYGFEIKYPKDWAFEEETKDYEGALKKSYTITIFHPKDMGSDIYGQITIVFSETEDNNEMFEKLLNLQRKIEGATIKDITINGIEGIESVEHYQIEKARSMVITQIFPNVRDRICRIVLLTADFNNNFYQNQVKQILSTFRFLE